MLISPHKKFIFVHIPKTAGTSIRNSLVSGLTIQRSKTLRFHAKAIDIRNSIDCELYNSAFKFTFVRNPWDLQVSLYHYILKRPQHHKHDETKALGCFKNFVLTSKSPQFTQTSYLVDETGNLIVDFVGRFENIEADFQTVCNNIGVSSKLIHCNKTNHVCYKDYYDADTIKLTGRLFAEDIERFGYVF